MPCMLKRCSLCSSILIVSLLAMSVDAAEKSEYARDEAREIIKKKRADFRDAIDRSRGLQQVIKGNVAEFERTVADRAAQVPAIKDAIKARDELVTQLEEARKR